MITPIEILRTNVAMMDELAIAYANALVAYWQAGDTEQEEALRTMMALHEELSAAAKKVAHTL